MANLLYDRQERRVRSLWRLLLQLLWVVIALLVLNTVMIALAVGVALLSGKIPTEALQSSALPQIMAVVSRSPLVRYLSPVVTLAGMLLSVWLAGKVLDRRRFASFGFHFNRDWWVDLGFGMLLGALLMAVIFAVELAAGWVTVTDTLQNLDANNSFASGMARSLILFLCVGIYEELFSRGYHLRNIAEGLQWRFWSARTALIAGYVLSSAVFGVLHLGNPNASLISTLNLVLAGLFLGLGYVLTGELAISIGLHITWNFFQGNVFGFPVSGGSAAVSFLGIQQGGPELWTGGAFGPEAGLVGLLAMLLGSGLILLWVRYQHGEIRLRDELAVYGRPAAAVAEPAPELQPEPAEV